MTMRKNYSRPLMPLVRALFLTVLTQLPVLAVPIRFLPWDAEIAARKVAFKSGKDLIPLDGLTPYKRSKATNATIGEIPLELVATDRKSADGKPVAIVIPLTAGNQLPLILILPDPNHPTGLKPFVIEDDASKFPWGTARFINASGRSLMVGYDKAVAALPAAWTPVDLAATGPARNVPVRIALREDPKNLLYSAVWEHDPEVRNLAFVIGSKDESTGSIQFKILPEDRRTLTP